MQKPTEQTIRDAFITGLTSNSIRQRLLKATQDLQPTFEQARSLNIAQRNSDAYTNEHYKFAYS